MSTRSRRWGAAALLLAAALLAACAEQQDGPAAEPGAELTDVTLMLDWVPNTNHTGLFVAQAEGYYEEAGLNVEIVQPGEVLAEQAVSAGAVEFGISFQEQVTLSRATDPESEIVSIAAIIQHNTSGFASPAALGVESPAGWEGLTYGAFGTPFEEPTLQGLMNCAGADFAQLDIVNVGLADHVRNISAKHEGGDPDVEAQLEAEGKHTSDILDYFRDKQEIIESGDWDHLLMNYLEKHNALNRTARALTECGLAFIAAPALHHL